jgi:phosphatidylserine/phosphatidylglycerophosphate/cardiolipin synthase-like enzyme
MAGRKKKSTQTTFALLGFVIVVILGAIYSLTGKDLTGSFTETATPVNSVPTNIVVPTVPSNNTSGGWWEVYFTDLVNMNNPDQWQGSIGDKLIQKINSATSSIHIASFEFDLTPVAEALISAKQRGVDVLWVTDNESGLEADEDPGHGQFAML